MTTVSVQKTDFMQVLAGTGRKLARPLGAKSAPFLTRVKPPTLSLQPIVAIETNRTVSQLSIGDLAKQTRVKVVTTRYYEQIGLLPVPVPS